MLALELDASNAAAVLRGLGLLPSGSDPVVEPLGGGVSSRVLVARVGRTGFVLKQPRGRFLVKEEWLVDERRADVEADFAQLMHETPGAPRCAKLLAYDRRERILVFELAPDSFQPWKQRLLAGTIEPVVADRVGAALAAIHNLGRARPDLRPRFDQAALFDQQRIDPYLRAALKKNPDLSRELAPPIGRLETDRTTLIHGDFSPKNILTDGRDIILLDHEVATWNDPAFDVAFLLTHLLLKSLHMKDRSAEILALAKRAYGAYRRDLRPELVGKLSHAPRLLAALLLARVDGKSPVEYLSPDERTRVRSRARTLLARPPSGLDTVAEWGSA